MKRLIIAALCCCLTAAAAYAQQQNRPDNDRTKPDNDRTKTESCTVRESGWSVDIGIGKAGDVTRERNCETKESAPKEQKEQKEPRERPGKDN